jgi:hypothetical protein
MDNIKLSSGTNQPGSVISELEVKMIEYIGKGFRKIVVYPRGGSISRT